MSHHTTIRLEDVSLERNGKKILDCVSFSIPAGKITTVLGPSGSGKTSVLRLLNRLDDPSSGNIILGEDDITSLDPRELRRRVGMVFQVPVMFDGTVRANLEQTKGFCRERECLKIEGLMSLVDLPEDYTERVASDLSVGEQQRVQLARTLIGQPEVLLLDEPTSGLDIATSERILALIKKVNRETGTSVVFVTHVLEHARELADQVALIVKGSIRREAPAKAFFKGGMRKLTALFRSAKEQGK
ncbi:ATP-binding cassette domain-containing protein [candidate division WOR-3 bacterium]|uniref:ATP-binding cassette domain-containing protein n=1 Tax=candidate division WOR-3 bacterium TaxID=2052148 RepID=A0A9D5K803_UNCW3|nr:ATP-binding cassette domain-containing protein [candidate division WOR-3 bacterium]MBD3364083.1 ATP-binding cassette domain-containing protein [candidate division WOR-3 bacterium]